MLQNLLQNVLVVGITTEDTAIMFRPPKKHTADRETPVTPWTLNLQASMMMMS